MVLLPWMTRQLHQGSSWLHLRLLAADADDAFNSYTEMVDARSRELLDKLAAATDNARIKLKVTGLTFIRHQSWQALIVHRVGAHADVPD